ncbi:MAG: peptidylprolyl isomerase [Nitrospirota bacterium]
MPNKLKAIAAVCALLFVFAACAKKGEQAGGTTQAGNSPVLAVVNGQDITAADYQDEAAALSPYAVKALEDPKNKQKFLENLEDKQLIVQKAETMGLDKDPEMAAKLHRLKDTLLLGEFVKKEILDKATVTDQDVKAYFDQHKADLGAVRISHILVATQQEAQDVLKKLKAGANFAALAKQYSLDEKTKVSGGDLGWVKWEQFGSPSLKDAAFKLNPGEISGIVQSQFGYHIMKVTDKKPALDSDYNKIKDALREQVAEKKKEDLFESYVKDLRAKAKITMNTQNLAAVGVAPQQPPEQPEAPSQKQ